MGNCRFCGTKRPLIEIRPWSQIDGEIICPDCAEREIAEENAAAEKVPVLTGDLRTGYEVIDSIFAIDSTTDSFLVGLNPDDAFEGVKQQLRKRCLNLGGNAVVNCHFEYRNALADGVIGKKQSLEIFAYGTAVRLKD